MKVTIVVLCMLPLLLHAEPPAEKSRTQEEVQALFDQAFASADSIEVVPLTADLRLGKTMFVIRGDTEIQDVAKRFRFEIPPEAENQKIYCSCRDQFRLLLRKDDGVVFTVALAHGTLVGCIEIWPSGGMVGIDPVLMTPFYEGLIRMLPTEDPRRVYLERERGEPGATDNPGGAQ